MSRFAVMITQCDGCGLNNHDAQIEIWEERHVVGGRTLAVDLCQNCRDRLTFTQILSTYADRGVPVEMPKKRGRGSGPDEKGLYRCEFCPRSFKTSSGRSRHVTRTHPEKK